MIETLSEFFAHLETIDEKKYRECAKEFVQTMMRSKKSLSPGAKNMIHEMYMADTKENAFKAYDAFVKLYQDKYPKAVDCLTKDKDVLFTFYDFPAVHWIHIRTTNAIESTFATVRHRHRQTKGCGSVKATLSMAFKLSMECEKRWRKIKGFHLITMVLLGVKFENGIERKVA